MASVTFRALPTVNGIRRYAVTTSNLGDNLPRKTPLSTDEMMVLKPIPRFVHPIGVDRRAPRVHGESLR